MSEVIEWETHQFIIERVRFRRKISVSLRPFKTPIIKCNVATSNQVIMQFLAYSKSWLDKQFAKWKDLHPPPNRNGFPGESILFFLAESHVFVVHSHRTAPSHGFAGGAAV